MACDSQSPLRRRRCMILGFVAARFVLRLLAASCYGFRLAGAVSAGKFVPGLEPEGGPESLPASAAPYSAQQSSVSRRSLSMTAPGSKSPATGYMPSKPGGNLRVAMPRSLPFVPNEESDDGDDISVDDDAEEAPSPRPRPQRSHSQSSGTSMPPPVPDTIHEFRKRRIKRAFDAEEAERMRLLLVEGLRKKGRGPDGRLLNPPKEPEPPKPTVVELVPPPEPDLPLMADQFVAAAPPPTPWLLYGGIGGVALLFILCGCGCCLMFLMKKSPQNNSRSKKGKSSKNQHHRRPDTRSGEVRVVGYMPQR